jgi:nucleotide-binding universal stress UspA family protein
MIALKNVLVATDFGEASEAALAYGRDMARTYGATLHVMHVAENVLAQFGAETYTMTLPSLQQEVEAVAASRLKALVTDEDRRQLRAKTILRVSTSPAAAIVDYAKEANVDIIVMGTHGRGFVSHLFLGSVAERVVRLAPCPVLTVRHPEHEFILPDALVAVAKH